MSQSGAQPLGSVNTRFAQESKIVEIQLPLLFVFANKQGSEKINCFRSQFLSRMYACVCNNNFTSGDYGLVLSRFVRMKQMYL